MTQFLVAGFAAIGLVTTVTLFATVIWAKIRPHLGLSPCPHGEITFDQISDTEAIHPECGTIVDCTMDAMTAHAARCPMLGCDPAESAPAGEQEMTDRDIRSIMAAQADFLGDVAATEISRGATLDGEPA